MHRARLQTRLRRRRRTALCINRCSLESCRGAFADCNEVPLKHCSWLMFVVRIVKSICAGLDLGPIGRKYC